MSEEKELSQLREKIDKLDHEIHELINERAKLALEACAVKIKYHGDQAQLYRPEREQAILDKVIAHNSGPLNDEAIRHIFKTIIQACLTLETEKHKRSST